MIADKVLAGYAIRLEDARFELLTLQNLPDMAYENAVELVGTDLYSTRIYLLLRLYKQEIEGVIDELTDLIEAVRRITRESTTAVLDRVHTNGDIDWECNDW